METLSTSGRNLDQQNFSAEFRPVSVIGELNADLLLTGLNSFPQLGREVLASHFETALGSASAIFASGMARLGHSVNFHSRVGDDDSGRFCLAALRKLGIPTGNVTVSTSTPTGVTVALSTTADRALVTFLGAIAELNYQDLPPNALDGSSHLHLTSFFLQHGLRRSFAQLFRDAHQRGMTTSFDPNGDPSESWTPDIWEVIAETDILFVNEVESLSLTKETTVESAMASLATKAPRVVIKLGAQGAMGCANGEIVTVPPFPISPVDTTGAGDSFAAGFVHAYLSGKTLHECLQTGSACGAMSALGIGGTAGQPTRDGLAAFLLRHQPRVDAVSDERNAPATVLRR